MVLRCMTECTLHQTTKCGRAQVLCEVVCQLPLGVDMNHFSLSCLLAFSGEVILYINVFGSGVVLSILRDQPASHVVLQDGNLGLL